MAQVVNADVPERDFWQVVLGSAAITQQLCTVIAAVSVPVHLRLGLITGRALLLVDIALLLVGEPSCDCPRWFNIYLGLLRTLSSSVGKDIAVV